MFSLYNLYTMFSKGNHKTLFLSLELGVVMISKFMLMCHNYVHGMYAVQVDDGSVVAM